MPSDLALVFGSSVEGRPLTVTRRGDPLGVRVLVIGCIHGNEADGMAIVDRLESIEVPDGVELWLVPTINPDGTAADIRHNASGVDLNRNFPVNWAPLAEPGDWQYGGPSAASEPETSCACRPIDWGRRTRTARDRAARRMQLRRRGRGDATRAGRARVEGPGSVPVGNPL